jgi:hypothetical protein
LPAEALKLPDGHDAHVPGEVLPQPARYWLAMQFEALQVEHDVPEWGGHKRSELGCQLNFVPIQPVRKLKESRCRNTSPSSSHRLYIPSKGAVATQQHARLPRLPEEV